MSLQVWLPLIDGMKNQGLSGVTVPLYNATVQSDGKIGSCMKLTDTHELNYAPNFNTSSLSFCGWFKFDKSEIQTALNSVSITSGRTTPTGSLIGNQSYGGIGITWTTNNMYTSSGVLMHLVIYGTIRTSTISIVYTSGLLIDDTSFGKYVHFCLTWDHELRQLKLYMNGILRDGHTRTTNAFSDGVIRTLALNYTGVWSGNGPGAKIPFRANDIRVYDHCLSEKEVKEISKGLVCHYKLESHKLKNVFTSPTFDTSAAGGGWAHWGRDTAVGTYGQNTDKNFIYDKTKTYSHWVANGTAATTDYLLYQSPSFDTTISSAGYRTVIAIIKEENSLPITDSICYPTWNANIAASSLTLNHWTEVQHINDGHYLCKCEGICQNGSNNLVGIYVKPGYKIYVSECYMENYATSSSYIDNILATTDVMTDSSGYGRDGEFLSGTVVPVKVNYMGRNLSGIENLNGYTGKAEVNVPALDTITFAWWGYYKEFGKQSSGLFCTSNNASSPDDYTTTAFNHRDQGFDICNTAGTHIFLGSLTMNLNVWQHFAVTYDGATVKYYVNGTLNKSTSITGPLKDFKYLWIGYSRAGGATRMCKGVVSDFRVYCTCLLQDEITNLYNVGSSIDRNGNLFSYELKEV